MAKRIVFHGKNDVRFETFDPGTPEKDALLFRTEYSLMSTGTETIVLNRSFSGATLWDEWVQYPFYPGYCCTGVIDGGAADGFTKGQRAILRWNHASHHVCRAADLIAVPDWLEARDAVWYALAKITAQGAKAASYRINDSVCIIGAGPIGQLSVRWAFALGVKNIVVCDLSAKRLEIALEGGATAVVPGDIGTAAEAVKRESGGALPGIVIDSTGAAPVFAQALKLCGDFGRLVLLGDTGYPERQNLTGDVVTRGLTIRGAHDSHTDEHWNEKSIAELWFSLLKSGRFRMKGLNTHVFKGSDCVTAYETANRERESTMGILFDWRDTTGDC